MTGSFLALAPEVCTLPTAERPLRVAEFERLCTEGLRGQLRVSRVALRWFLDPGWEAYARDLAAKESACCTFFSFTITPSSGAVGRSSASSAGSSVVSSRGASAGSSVEVVVVLDVEVPASQGAVLDALQAMAASGLAGQVRS